jgi:hypothetical protein
MLGTFVDITLSVAVVGILMLLHNLGNVAMQCRHSVRLYNKIV